MEELVRGVLDGLHHLRVAWPVLQTAMPAAKSRKRLPSTSHTSTPLPWDITNG